MRLLGPVRAATVVLASGTFLGGILHCGEEAVEGGRRGEAAASTLSGDLRQAGIPLGRFKTGTPPRLRRDSIDWALTRAQHGDEEPTFFCPETQATALPQAPCYETHSTPETHAIIGDASDQLVGAVLRFVGNDDDIEFVGRVILFQFVAHGLGDVRGFIVGGNQHGDCRFVPLVGRFGWDAP